ncbi:MAG: EAL domain-containing protein [Agathobacter sp.]|nr:EAL domain-containing protein [Agathobacter sp.]
MQDVLFDYKYVVQGDIIAFVLSIVVHFLLKSTYMVKRSNLNIFKTANRLIGVSAVTSIFYHYMIEYVRAENIIRLYFCRGLTYSALIVIYICFCVYIKNLAEMSKKYEKLFAVTVYGAGVFFSILEFVGPYFKIGFYVDENFQIHQNYYTDIFRYAYVYYSVIMVIMLIVYRKKFLPRMYRCIWSVMCIAVLLMAYQAEFLQTAYTVVSFTFPIIMVLFLFHYNPYDVNTGTLDYFAFQEYVDENKEKRFSMVFLTLPGIGKEGMAIFSKELLRKNDSFFEGSCCFRLQDNRMVLTYEKQKNPDYEVILERLYKEFKRLNINNDYYIVMVDSNGMFLNANEYMAYCEYIEKRMSINSAKLENEELLAGFMKKKFIWINLQDIHKKQRLDDYRVKVYCQPVLNTMTGKFTTAEALMRLDLPQLGMVYPDQFVTMAEKENYIHTLSKIILHKTCQSIRELEEQGYEIERVSVNFSVQELHIDSFCEDVINIIKANGIDFQKIAVEITETRNEKDFVTMKKVITRLSELGIKFYLDDFGTGYSNFERLIGLPIDIIKFDRSLTILSSKNEESQFMVGSFSEIFKKAEYQILFEGVENETDEMRCIDMNAQYLQGYKYSKPIPIDQLKEFLDKKV